METEKLGEMSLPDGIQEGFTEAVTFRKLSKLQNIERQTGAGGERVGERRRLPGPQGPFQHLLTHGLRGQAQTPPPALFLGHSSVLSWSHTSSWPVVSQGLPAATALTAPSCLDWWAADMALPRSRPNCSAVSGTNGITALFVGMKISMCERE